jgi:MoaA/NifB/PqqE/SkfB family radical SAM enzyme
MGVGTKDIAGAAAWNPRLSIEVTTRCNCACVYCFAAARHGATAEMPVDVVKDILVQGHRMSYRHLHITGGEPLLHDDIFQILDDAVNLGYETILMNTNGLQLDRSICSRLSCYPGLSVTLSLEGMKSLHDRFRGEGSYRKVMSGLEIGISAGLDVIIFTTACKSVLPLLPHFADTLAGRFPELLYLTLIRLINTVGDTFPLASECLTPADFLELVNMVAMINLYGLRTCLLNEPLINVVSKVLDRPWVPMSQDLTQGDNLMVMADQRICSSHTGREKYGKYAPGSIKKILVSDQYLRATATDTHICPTCGHAGLCQANGLLRPAKWHMPGPHDLPFCRRVLDLIA